MNNAILLCIDTLFAEKCVSAAKDGKGQQYHFACYMKFYAEKSSRTYCCVDQNEKYLEQYNTLCHDCAPPKMAKKIPVGKAHDHWIYSSLPAS